MTVQQTSHVRPTGLLVPLLRAWLLRRPYQIALTMGDEWVTHCTPSLRRLLFMRRHYRSVGYR